MHNLPNVIVGLYFFIIAVKFIRIFIMLNIKSFHEFSDEDADIEEISHLETAKRFIVYLFAEPLYSICRKLIKR